MQELLRQKFWDNNFVRAVQDFPNNMTVPVITDAGSPYGNWRGTGGVGIFFRPSKAMFQKYFEGKSLDYDQWQSSGKNIHPAVFEKIGFDPEKDTMKATLQKPEAKAPEAEKAPIEAAK
jgi:hypothetical protein